MVLRGEVRGGLGSEVVQFGRGDAIIYPLDHLDRNNGGIDELGVKPIAEFLDAGRDLVKHDRLFVPITFDDLHLLDLRAAHGGQQGEKGGSEQLCHLVCSLFVGGDLGQAGMNPCGDS